MTLGTSYPVSFKLPPATRAPQVWYPCAVGGQGREPRERLWGEGRAPEEPEPKGGFASLPPPRRPIVRSWSGDDHALNLKCRGEVAGRAGGNGAWGQPLRDLTSSRVSCTAHSEWRSLALAGMKQGPKTTPGGDETTLRHGNARLNEIRAEYAPIKDRPQKTLEGDSSGKIDGGRP